MYGQNARVTLPHRSVFALTSCLVINKKEALPSFSHETMVAEWSWLEMCESLGSYAALDIDAASAVNIGED